jgi:hypothetical protein
MQIEVFAPMVFCKECKQKVEECPHFVDPIKAPRTPVFDEKIESLAYNEPDRILEIAYRNGQVWQLSPVPPGLAQEIRDTSLWSFIRFIAQRYKAAPVRKEAKTLVPTSKECPGCTKPMTIRHQTSGPPVRVLWNCAACDKSLWYDYSNEPARDAKKRWH